MSENIVYIAPLKAYDQTWSYYQRVIGDNGTLIDAESVNRIYHGLNLLNLQNRNYKLYQASAGLQKTDDQIIKLYDQGKDDVDQTFSGSDRPEFIEKWWNGPEVSTEKEATNYNKHSRDFRNWVQKRLQVVSTNNLAPDGSHTASKIGNSSTTSTLTRRIESNTFSVTSGDEVCASFFVKYIGEVDRLTIRGMGNSYQNGFQLRINFNPFSIGFQNDVLDYFVEEFDDGWYRVTAVDIATADDNAASVWLYAGADENDPIGYGFLAWNVDITKLRIPTNTIYTNGNIVTRLSTDIVLQDFLPVDNLQEKAAIWGWDNLMLGDGDYDFQTRTPVFSFSIPNQLRNFELGQPSISNRLSFFVNDNNENFTVGDPFTRYTVFYLVQFDNGYAELYFGYDNGDLRKVTAFNYTANKQVSKDGFFGSANSSGGSKLSNRVKLLGSRKTFFTEDEAKQLFEITGKSIIGSSFQINSYTDET